jgi:hypothetical protein
MAWPEDLEFMCMNRATLSLMRRNPVIRRDLHQWSATVAAADHHGFANEQAMTLTKTLPSPVAAATLGAIALA